MNHSNEKNLERKQRLRLLFVFHFFPRLLIACVRVASLVSSFDMVAAGSPSLTFKMPLYNSPCMIIAATDIQGDIQGQVTDTRDTHTPDYEKHVNLCPCLCAYLCPLRTMFENSLAWVPLRVSHVSFLFVPSFLPLSLVHRPPSTSSICFYTNTFSSLKRKLLLL
jgi:hypothetical protein